MSPRGKENLFLAVVATAIVLVGFAVGWESHRYRDAIERCYGDEPCPFGPGIVGSRECRGGKLAEKCRPPKPVQAKSLSLTRDESEALVVQLVDDAAFTEPTRHFHNAAGECFGLDSACRATDTYHEPPAADDGSDGVGARQ